MIILILFSFISCNDKQTKSDRLSKGKVEAALTNLLIKRKLDSVKYLVVIPNGGCTGCIHNSIRYLSMNLKKIDSVYVIFYTSQR